LTTLYLSGAKNGLRRISTDACSGKRLTRPPTDHFKRLLEEACPNLAYPVWHKLKECSMMRSFMTSGSLTCGIELDKRPNGSDTTPFPEENTTMIVYGGRPHREAAARLAQAVGHQLVMGGDVGAGGVMALVFLYLNKILIYIYTHIYIY
jgi:hypothetical protein